MSKLRRAALAYCVRVYRNASRVIVSSIPCPTLHQPDLARRPGTAKMG